MRVKAYTAYEAGRTIDRMLSKIERNGFAGRGALERLIRPGNIATTFGGRFPEIDASSQVRPVRSLAKDIGIEMKEIQAGQFIFQGHEGVNNNGFRIAETPFTNGHFRALFEKEPDALEEILKRDPMEFLLASLDVSAKDNTAYDKENSPLVYISQIEATAMAELIGMRLLTEQEWERAAAYTDGRDFPYGNRIDIKRHTFNDKGTRSVYAHPEGASEEGVLDLAGNIWEWTSTPYGEIDFTDINNPIFQKRSKTYSLRGGSWRINSQGSLTGSDRTGDAPEYRSDSVGFRLAEDLK